MSTTMIIEIHFHSFWHIGTGRGAGAGADALQFTNVDGLPIWPGKSIKGVFRDAFRQAVTLDSLPHTHDELIQLFGPEVQDDSQSATSGRVTMRFQNAKGTLRFSDARVAPPSEYPTISQWANNQQSKKYLDLFYQDVANIALEEDGTVTSGALRMVQLTKPIPLFMELQFHGQDTAAAQQAFERIESTYPLIRLAGASRTRGLGRLSLQTMQEV